MEHPDSPSAPRARPVSEAPTPAATASPTPATGGAVAPDATVLVNGKPMASTPVEGGKRAVVMLSGQGSYVVTSR